MKGDERIRTAVPAPSDETAYERRAETLARLFHETYESLAPSYNYRTRRRSAVPWEQVPADNRQLMLETAAIVLDAIDRGAVS